jgi:hypothetical protein
VEGREGAVKVFGHEPEEAKTQEGIERTLELNTRVLATDWQSEQNPEGEAHQRQEGTDCRKSARLIARENP